MTAMRHSGLIHSHIRLRYLPPDEETPSDAVCISNSTAPIDDFLEHFGRSGRYIFGRDVTGRLYPAFAQSHSAFLIGRFSWGAVERYPRSGDYPLDIVFSAFPS
jgi:hypothetical protein